MNQNEQSKINQSNTFNTEIKKTNIYQDRKNLYKFYKKNHYIYQKFINECNQKVYSAYKNFKEFYSKIFDDVNMIITESTHYCHKCK